MTRDPHDPQDLMTLAEAAKASGVPKRIIEYYVLLGLVEPIRRQRGKVQRRYFDATLVRRIELIRRLNAAGYALGELRETYFRSR